MNLLKVMRAANNLSQQNLANQVGKSQSWISRVEGGRLLPEREQARKIAQVFRHDSGMFFDTYRLA